LQRRQQKLDEDYKNAETILAATLEVYTKAAPHKNDLGTAVDVMNEFTVLQLNQFTHARSLPTMSSRGAEFNHAGGDYRKLAATTRALSLTKI
jgi:hypothetical protein